MKTFILTLLLLAVLGGAYVYYQIDTKVAEAPVVETGVADETPLPTTSAPAQIAVFENTDYDFMFKYRIKPYGYSVFESSAEQNIDMETLFGVTLIRSDDYNESVKAAADGNAHDGPPAISLYVFSASKVLDLSAWLVGKRMITNCAEGQVLATTLDGKDAMSCLSDGLYPGVTVAQIHNNRIYVLIGTREGAETPDGYSYEKDFNEIISSFAHTD